MRDETSWAGSARRSGTDLRRSRDRAGAARESVASRTMDPASAGRESVLSPSTPASRSAADGEPDRAVAAVEVVARYAATYACRAEKRGRAGSQPPGTLV